MHKVMGAPNDTLCPEKASGATAGLNHRSPATCVHMTLRGGVEESVWAVVKCATDAIFYCEAHCRVVVPQMRSHAP